MSGDECLGALNMEMMEVAQRVGAAAKFTGSGGAAVAFYPDEPSQAKLREDECRKAGFILKPIQVGSIPFELRQSRRKEELLSTDESWQIGITTTTLIYIF
ncbi:hypothetical protein NL676_010873 [Syzygium grande]|nr:hypothetical protein NL676_010873 [Syzygium grande]